VRRLYFPWVLSLLLVFAQHGAVLHELGHLKHGDRAQTATLTAQQPADAVCATCEAFAQVANPASGGTHTLAACAPVFLPVSAPVGTLLAADIPTPRNRGPPHA
jgi:hypothetical protein